jgi:autotransporter-associated beta strand protein
MSMMGKRIAVTLTCLVLQAAVRAADGTWTGTVDGAWSDTANWQGGTVASNAGSVAYLSNLAGPIGISNDVADLRLKGLTALGGAYTLSGLPLTLDGDLTGSYGLIASSGAHTVGAAVRLQTGSQVNVGAGASLTTAGLLDYLGNATLTKRGAGEWVFAGACYETNASAFLDVVGGTLRVAPGAVLTKRGGNRENLRIGYGGTAGHAVVESGAELNVAGFVLGHDTVAATGYMLIDGGTLTANMTGTDNPVLVGRWATGTLCASNNAAIDITDWFNLGVYTRGELHIGGNSTMTVGRFSLGWHTQEVTTFAGPGVAKVGSGLLSVANQFVWRSSNVASRTNLVTVGNGTAGSATLRLPATMRTASTAGGARLTLDGGKLEMIGLRTIATGVSLTNYLFGLEQLWIGRAGATLDTGTNAITITQVLERDPAVTRDGGVTKSGAGELTLTGACAYDGPTVVAQGTLRMTGAQATGVAVLAPGATLSLADGQYRAFAPSALTAGQGGESVIKLEAGAGGASDRLTLAAGSQVGVVLFQLVGLGGSGPYWFPGDYVVATYAGSDPVVTGWHAEAPLGLSAAFEVQPAQKRVVLHVTGVAIGYSAWIAPGGGAWGDAGNWNIAPASDPATAVRFGGALGMDAAIALGSAVTLGTLTFDTPYACTLSGAGITFGADGAGGTLAVAQGSQVLQSAVSLPEDLSVAAQPGASVLLGGGATGSGRVTVTGGGTLAITNGAAFDVPLTVNGATLGATEPTTLDSPLTVGADGATLNPAYGQTLTLSGMIDGAGTLAKDGSNIAVLSGTNSCTGEVEVKKGTLEIASLTEGGELVIGAGRLRYTGPNAVVDRGFTIRTSDAKLGATFETDADVTFNGNIQTDNGVFIKAGSGTVTFAATGVNTLGTGQGSDNYSAVMNFGPYGESPTTGLRVFNVINGKVIMGLPGQTNVMNNQTLIVGGQTTTAAGEETAGHLEINGGYLSCGTITIGRGNGTPFTAPVPLESSVTINSGRVQSSGVWLAANLNNMTTYRVNASPRFVMNGGELTGSALFCGNATCSITPKLYFNGGFAAFTGGLADDVRLAYAAGVTSETFVAGGTLAVSNTTIRLAENFSTAKGVLRLNGGRVITRGINRQGSGVGELYLNGGILQACQNMTLTNLSSAVVQAGGFVADVPAGLTLTLRQTLTHDAALGGTPDGGLVKLGAGALDVDFDQTYTGPTVVSGGVLRVAGSLAATDLTLADGTTLSLADGVEQVFAPTTFIAGVVTVELDVAADGSVYDVLALPEGGGGTLRLRLFKTGTALRFASPGRYPLITFSGTAPDTSAWSVDGLETVTAFEEEGTTVYVRIGAGSGSVSASVWTNETGGAWADAGNWSTAPASDASANVLFGGAITAPATITTGGGATFGYLAVDSANAYTWSGGALTLGSAESNATVHVVQGAHLVEAEMAAPSVATLAVDAGASLAVRGAVTGAGSLSVTGGGTLALTNGPAVDVPVSVDGVTVTLPLSTTFDTPFTLGSGGAVFAPDTAQTVEFTSELTGPGGLTKNGSSILTLSGGAGFTGDLTVRNGTVSVADEPAGNLVLGEGTLKYTGPSATFTRGYTVRTTTSTQAATIDTDADITLNGQVQADRGAFIKLGNGTLTYAYGGENILSAGDNQATGSTYLDVQPYGDTPTQGYRSYNIYKGKVVLGAVGQTNRFSQAIIIGGQSTTNADAETAAHMEINGGVNIFQDFITVGRGNGSEITAPTGVVSTLTINGGESTANGFWMAAKQSFQTTLTARPRFTMNDGTLSTTSFKCGSTGGTPRPQIEINGGVLTVGPNEPMILAVSAGTVTEMTINGGNVILTNQGVRLAENAVGATAVLNLNGGRLTAQTIYLGGASGSGVVTFNGGVFQPSATAAMDAAVVLTNRAGGAIFDVPAAVVYTLQSTLNHDETLGATPDGGVVKLGAGTLVLANTQAYTGPTLVSNGTLEVTGTLPAEAELAVEPEGALVLTAPVGAARDVGSLLLGSASGAEAGLTLTADPAQFESGGALALSGDLFLGKTAVTLLPRGISMAAVTNGTYVVMTCGGTISGSADDLRLANGVFGKSYAFSVAGSEVLLTVALATANAEIWSSMTGGEWTESGNWITPPGAGAVSMTIGFGQAITGPATVNLDGAVTAGTLLFNNPNAYTLSGAGSVAFAVSNGTAGVTVEQGAHRVAVAAALDNDLTTTLAVGTELALTGAVTGDGKLTKAGDGTLALSGANTYSGGTAVNVGTVDVAGSSPLGTGTVVFDGGSLVANGDAPATLPNALTVNAYLAINTAQPLTFSGDWTATGNSVITKSGTNELTVAGAMQPVSGIAERLALTDGSVRFAAGADALFRSDVNRNAINFETAVSDSAVRHLSVEGGASVSASCLYVGFGATNTVSVSGGTLSLTGFTGGGNTDALVSGGGSSATVPILDQFLFSGGSVYSADNAWWFMGAWNRSHSVMDVSGGVVSLGQFSLGNRDYTSPLSDYNVTDVTVSGGLLEARQRWNWMADANGTRLNTVFLNGGRLRLPATYASVANMINQSRLVFNGGTLETPGGGTAAEDPESYLAGLKQAYVGDGGAVIDTQGRDVTLAQRLMTLDGETGGVVKRGLGTLTLAEPPCVTGRIDVHSGTLRLAPEAGDAYPDDALVRLTFEDGIQVDSSDYSRAISLVGSIGNLASVDAPHGTNAVRFNAANTLLVDYTGDMKNADTFTISAWVRQSAYQTITKRQTILSTIASYANVAQEYLLRIIPDSGSGNFRFLGTAENNYGYGSFTADVVGAVPLNTWVMLTFVADGKNGFRMYVNGEQRTMKVTLSGNSTYTNVYGIGKTWLMQPPTKISGRAFNIATVGSGDTEGFVGDLDDVTVYRRALSATEIATLYTVSNPFAKRVRAAAGATLDLAGATQEVAEVTGEGFVGNGTAVVTGTLNPGDSAESAAGALLTASGNLTLSTNMTYVCNWTPEANDLVDVWGTLTVNGAGVIDLGLSLPSQMPGYPRQKSFPVMVYTDISGAANFSQWSVTGTGRTATATVSATGGAVWVNLEVFSGTLMLLR